MAASTSRAAKVGRPPVCIGSVRMSGVLGQKLGRKYSRTPVCVSSRRYSSSSCLPLRQVKYVYD